MSQSLNTPVIQVEHLKTKFDTVVVSNSLIALLDYDYNQARFLQQLHYWSYSKYGVVIDGIRWIYKSAKEWLSEALAGLTEWKLRCAIASLLEKNLIRREKLFARHQQQEYSRFWWQPKNQTYYYSINYEELQRLIEKAQTTENIRIERGSSRRRQAQEQVSLEDSNQTKYCELSRNSTKNTNHKKKTNKQPSDRISTKSSSFAASLDNSQEKETANSSAYSDSAKSGNSFNRETPRQEKATHRIDFLINKKIKRFRRCGDKS